MTMITETKPGTRFRATPMFSPMAIIKAIIDSMRFHRSLNALDELDDRMLKDIGLTRSDLVDLRIASSPAENYASMRRMRLHR